MLALLAGCTSQPVTQDKPAITSRNPELVAPDLYPGGTAQDKDPTVRYGRYTMVNTLPDEGQRDLMSQIIDVSIPSGMSPSIHDAMEYVTARSGYGLCPSGTGPVGILYSRPLPAAQYKLGPMSLRNTLQVLAGPAWQVKVDEVSRNVCFNLRAGYEAPVQPVAAKPVLADSLPHTSGTTATQSAVVTAPVAASTPIVTSPTPAAKSPAPSSPVATAKDGHPLDATPAKAAAVATTAPALPTPSQASGKPVAVVHTDTLASSTASVPGKQVTPASTPGATALSATVSSPAAPKAPTFSARVEDGNLRHTLSRWSKAAGWTFDEEHYWVSPVDIPITASATFPGDFVAATQGLLATTELTDTPLQPCFYDNNVVRVVGFNVTCDPGNGR